MSGILSYFLIIVLLFIPSLNDEVVIDNYSINGSYITISFIKSNLNEVIIDNLCYRGNNRITTSIPYKIDEVIEVKCAVNSTIVADRLIISKNDKLTLDRPFLGVKIESIDKKIKIHECYYKFDFFNKDEYQCNNSQIKLNPYFNFSICYDNLYMNLKTTSCKLLLYLDINTFNYFSYKEDSYYEFELSHQFDGYKNKLNFQFNIIYDMRNFSIISYQINENGDDYILLPKGNRISYIKCFLILENLFDDFNCKIPWIIEFDKKLYSNDYDGNYHLISQNEGNEYYNEQSYI